MTARIFGMVILMCVFFDLKSQQITQNIKGRVVDVDTHVLLPGVNVYLVGSNPPIGTISDAEGYFVLRNVPVGRHSVQFSFMGYEPAIFKEISVGSSKEVALSVKLKESLQQLEEVVVTPSFRKDKARNNMATLSARSFSVEEASRYAGGWNDPSRLAGSFAGVSMAEGVNDNAIVIRGNAPKGLLWRLEGVEIPAPNHLSGVNNGGGIETVFSVNVLANSDFYTGAFPAEFGNAMSGTFDMKMRNGNRDKRESSLRIGSQGIDICSEGPLGKQHNASYLFNYRYSTMGLIGNMAGDGFGMPDYRDLSFKLNLPTKKAGTFSVWGIGGWSSVAFEPDGDVDEWENTFDNNEYETGSDVAAAGVSHHVNLGSRSYMHSSVALTYDAFSMESDQLQRDNSVVPLADHNEDNTRFVVSSYVNNKISKRLTVKTGAEFTAQSYNLDVKGNEEPGVNNELSRIARQSGNANILRAYAEVKLRLAPTFDINGGVCLSYFDMNEETAPEPRIGMTWTFRPKHSVNLAYGKHSRLEPMRFYQAKDEAGNLLNPGLKVTKARHYGFAYDYRINDNMKLKIEPYYQELYDVPVVAGSSESLVNYTWNMYFRDALTNEGTGTNMGVDLTLERYMKDGFYYMFTGSVFDSKYTGGDGMERNTSFNRNFVFNLLGGKEWTLRENNMFGINGKIAYMGGNRFTPADRDLSRINEMVVLDENRAFEWQENNKFYVDIAFNYRINKNNKSHVLGLQAKNALMQKEMFGWAYDFNKQTVVEHGITMVYPYFTYKLEF